MKVKAKHWVKYHGQWHKAGEVFTVDDADAQDMAAFAETVSAEPEEHEETAERPEPAKRGRKRKAESEE